jgi:hypothetical protein
MGSAYLSKIEAQKLPENNEEREKEEYLAILAVFERFIESMDNDLSSQEILEELMELRADFAIHHAIRGFGMEYDEALELIRMAEDGLTESEKAKRNIIVAAIDNLVDFAVAEEYQMTQELSEFDIDEFTGYDVAEGEEEDIYDTLVKICKKYNFQYANVENMDIEYAMIIAAQLLPVSSGSILMYMTQGDERVRPWHLQYEGFSALKSNFPAWLIPPIEHRCRCYLIEDTISSLAAVQNAAVRVPSIPDWFNPTFKESVALGGRIFSDEHPYFDMQDEYAGTLREVAERIKQRYWNG